VAVILAVMTAKSGGDGWESNPPRTPQQRPANGFEDRGEHQLSIIPGLTEPYFGCQTRRGQELALELSQVISDAPQTVLKTAESTSSRSSPAYLSPILAVRPRRDVSSARW
jgi:hypothetical protein